VDEKARRQEDGNPAPAEIVDRPFPLFFRTGAVRVEGRDGNARKYPGQFLGHRLDSPSLSPDKGPPAVGAIRGSGNRRVAVVTHPSIVFPVIGQGDVAAAAAGRLPALPAEGIGSVASPVDEQDDRVPPADPLSDLARQDARYDAPFAPVVYDDRPELPFLRVQGNQASVRPGFEIGFHARPGGSENADGSFGPGPDPGAGPGVEKLSLLLEVGLVGFLLDYEQAEALERRQKGRTGTDDHVGPAFDDCSPFDLPPEVRKPAMEEGDPAGPGAKRLEERFREGDLRGQEQDPASGRERFPDATRVGLPAGFPAAEKQDGTGSARGDPGFESGEGRRFAADEAELHLSGCIAGTRFRFLPSWPGNGLPDFDKPFALHAPEQGGKASKPHPFRKRSGSDGPVAEEERQLFFPTDERPRVQGFLPGRSQRDPAAVPGNERRRQGGLKDFPPGREEVFAERPGKCQEFRGEYGRRIEDLFDLLDLETVGGNVRDDGDDESGHHPAAERRPDAAAGGGPAAEVLGDRVMEGFRDGDRKNNLGEHG